MENGNPRLITRCLCTEISLIVNYGNYYVYGVGSKGMLDRPRMPRDMYTSRSSQGRGDKEPGSGTRPCNGCDPAEKYDIHILHTPRTSSIYLR